MLWRVHFSFLLLIAILFLARTSLIVADKGSYDEAMVYMNQTDLNDVLLNLRVKSMLMKIYYEQESYEALESLISSLKKYIIRKKVMGYYKENFKNVLHLTQKLVKLNPYNKAQKEKFRKEVESAGALISTEKAWLLEQLG